MTTFTLGTQFQVDANGGLARVAPLTSSTAIAMYSSAAAGIEARFLTRSGGTLIGGTVLTIDANAATSITICRLSDTTAVIGYCYGATHRVRVLSVSGTTLTANAVINMSDTGVTFLSSELLDTNKVIYVYTDGAGDGIAVILSVSGTTITENAGFTYENGHTVSYGVVVKLTTAVAVVGHGDATGGNTYAEALDISGTTITGNTRLTVSTVNVASSGDSSVIDMSVSISDTDYITYVFSTGTSILFTLLIHAAGTLTRDFAPAALESGGGGNTHNATSLATYQHTAGADPGYDLFISVSNEATADNLSIREYDQWFGNQGNDTSITTTDTVTTSVHTRLFPGTTVGIAVWNASTEAIVITIPGPTLTLASMTKPAAIDAAGEYIYLALLADGTPILSRISTDLNAAGTTVFNPGAGDQIGVECGRFNSDVVWVAGQFDGTNVIEKSEDGGTSFAVADDGTIGGIRSFVMGPDSDDRLLVFDEDNGDILETRNSGDTWTTINGSVTPEVYAMGRLGQNVQESVFGNQGAANDNVDYSVNSGDDLEDLTLPVNQDVTGIIVN